MSWILVDFDLSLLTKIAYVKHSNCENSSSAAKDGAVVDSALQTSVIGKISYRDFLKFLKVTRHVGINSNCIKRLLLGAMISAPKLKSSEIYFVS